VSEMILPGTYIDVLAEGLIAPGQVTVGNLGVLGTAAKGPAGVPTLLSNYNDAVAIFGSYDSFLDPADPTKRRADSLTLVRALEIAFQQGASTVYAVRVGNSDLANPHHLAVATAPLNSASGPCVTLQANSQGTWANAMTVTVTAPGSADVLTVEETTTLTQSQATAKEITLKHNATQSPRNRVLITMLDGTVETPAIVTTAPAPGQVQIAGNQLKLGDALAVGCIVTVSYAVDPAAFVNVTVTLGTTKEQYLVADGDALVTAVNVTGPSALVTATPGANSGEHPATGENVRFAGGWNGENQVSYSGAAGLDTLLDVDAHIIVAAGQANTTSGAALDAHCQLASTDVHKRDRIAIVGSDFAKQGTAQLQAQDIITYVDKLIGNTVSSDRVVFVAPGILATSSAQGESGQTVLLPGAYTAAVIAGMLAALPPHISLTNKPVAVQDLEVAFNNAQLTELVQNGVTAVEKSPGIHVLRGQTTQVSGAFREITTRRIVDYAKYGVRSAAASYIGLLNNDRVRAALRATINSFLKQMLDGEMLVGYTLDVTATRDQQIAGIAQVTMTLQPVFSINFIHVTMILS
jgi:hypothetical protein